MRLDDANNATGVPRNATEHGVGLVVLWIRALWDKTSSGPTTTAAVPVTHRLAIIYLMLPVVIWLVGWFEWWFGLPAAVLLAVGLWPVLAPASTSRNWRTISSALQSAARPTTVVLLLIAFAWVLTTAAGGIFDVNNPDWNKHRSILLDLVREDWPTEPSSVLRTYLDAPMLLRYNLGFYMAPGLIGKWLGISSLNWAVPLWTWCGVALALLLFTRGHTGWRLAAALLIAMFFGGMDLVRTFLIHGLDWMELGPYFEGWPNSRLGSHHFTVTVEEWGKYLKYHSHTFSLMWTPQHFIAGALYTLLLFRLRTHPRFISSCGVVLAVAPFWSPFIAIGLLSFIAALIVQNGIRPFLSWQNVVLSLPLAGLVMAYLSSGTEGITSNWIWEGNESGWQQILRSVLLFHVTEFMSLAALLLLLRAKLRRDPMFLACLATLILLPIYRYGSFNDFVMRGSIPALLLLSFYCSETITCQTNAFKGVRNLYSFCLSGLLIVVLGIGAVPTLFDLTRANSNRDLSVFRYSELDGSTSTVLNPAISGLSQQYLSMNFSTWFLEMLRLDAGAQASSKGILAVRSKYDVYVDNRNVVYLRHHCDETEEGSRFFLHVFPLVPSGLTDGRVHDNRDFYFSGKNAMQIGSFCFAVQKLPDFPVGYVRTGQFSRDLKRHSWISHFFTQELRDRLLEEAGEPIIHANFNVYFHEERPDRNSTQLARRRLLYYKPACREEDTSAPFFLHVFPVNVDSLPEGRKESGYEIIELEFNEFGGRSSDSCFAILDLPEYDINRIITGQTRGSALVFWEGSFAFSEQAGRG